MNCQFLKSSWMTGLLLWFITTCALAQNNLMLSLEIKVLENPIGPIDPLKFQLVITNTSSKDYTKLARWGMPNTTWVEFRSKDSSTWQSFDYLRPKHFMGPDFYRGKPLTLLAGKSRTLNLAVYDDSALSYRQRQDYLSTVGEYWLRAKYRVQEGQMIQSLPVSFRVEPYQGIDAQAFEWLKTRKKPYFMYNMAFAFDHSPDSTYENARILFSRFPNSRFAPWAKLLLAHCYYYGLWQSNRELAPSDLEKASVLAQEVLEHARLKARNAASATDLQESVQYLLEEIEVKRQAILKKQMPAHVKLSLEIKGLPESIASLELLKFQLVLTNTSSQDYILPRWKFGSTILVEYHAPNSSKWRKLKIPFLVKHVLEKKLQRQERKTLALSAGQSQTMDLSFLINVLHLSMWGQSLYDFGNFGEYRLRATYRPSTKQIVSSKEVRFWVKPYQGIDAKAFEWLKERQSLQGTEPFVFVTKTRFRMTHEDAQDLISRFPNSSFVPWAKLFLALHYRYGWRISLEEHEAPNLDKAAVLVQELIESADSKERKRQAPIPDEIRETAQQFLKEIEKKRSTTEVRN